MRVLQPWSVGCSTRQRLTLVRLPISPRTGVRIVCRIFYSLNWMTIPEEFQDNLPAWMPGFKKILTYSNKLLEDPDEEMQAGPVESAQAAIVENVNLCVSAPLWVGCAAGTRAHGPRCAQVRRQVRGRVRAVLPTVRGGHLVAADARGCDAKVRQPRRDIAALPELSHEQVHAPGRVPGNVWVGGAITA